MRIGITCEASTGGSGILATELGLIAAQEILDQSTGISVAEISRLEAERNAALTRLSSVSDAQIDALARRALERVLGPRDGGDP